MLLVVGNCGDGAKTLLGELLGIDSESVFRNTILASLSLIGKEFVRVNE